MFPNKWANLAFMLIVITVVCVIVVKNTKVLTADGKDAGNKLGFKAAA